MLTLELDPVGTLSERSVGHLLGLKAVAAKEFKGLGLDGVADSFPLALGLVLEVLELSLRSLEQRNIFAV